MINTVLCGITLYGFVTRTPPPRASTSRLPLSRLAFLSSRGHPSSLLSISLRLCARVCMYVQEGGGKRRRGASSFRGVVWDKDIGKWRAHIEDMGKRIFLGYFAEEDLQLAARVWDIALVNRDSMRVAGNSRVHLFL